MDDFLPMALQPQRACVTTRPVPLLKDFSSPVMGFGTCLCGEMLLAMAEAGFRTLYDATYCHHYGADSLLGFLELLDSGRPPGDEDLLTLEDGSLLAFPLNLDGLRFHGGQGREKALACLRLNLEACRADILSAATFVITLGTARVMRLRDGGRPITRVAEMPVELAASSVPGVEEQVEMLEGIRRRLARIRGGTPPVIVLALSPQRYLFASAVLAEGGDPIVDGVYCKSVLRVAAELFVARHPGDTHYFPGFEMVMEELRSVDGLAHHDLQHVSRQTIPFLAKRFLQTYASPGIVRQLNLAVAGGAVKARVADLLKGGMAPGDPRIQKDIENFLDLLGAAGPPLSPLTRRNLADLARLLEKAGAGGGCLDRLKAFPGAGQP